MILSIKKIFKFYFHIKCYKFDDLYHLHFDDKTVRDITHKPYTITMKNTS